MAVIQQFETSWLGWDQTNGRLVFWDGQTWRYFEAAAGLATAADLTAGLAAKQNLDADLSAIAALSPANDDVIQRKGDAWTNRTMAELLADLGALPLAGGIVSGGLGVGGATPDATNKLAVASPAVLFNHAGNGVQVKFNKAAAGEDAAFLFQTGFSARALLGLLGDDDFSFKVSPDGSNFFTSFVLDKANGNAAFLAPFGAAPSFPTIASDALTVTSSYAVPAPEAGSADDIATIDGGLDGALLVLSGTAGITITVKDDAGNLKLAGDFVLDNFDDTITLIKRGSTWLELARSNNG